MKRHSLKRRHRKAKLLKPFEHFFKREDQRKDKLWVALNLQTLETLAESDASLEQPQAYYEDIYEGLILVDQVHEYSLQVTLLDQDNEPCLLRVTAETQEHIRHQDTLYVILGQKEGRWHLLDVCSVGSQLIPTEAGQPMPTHFSVNPVHLNLGLAQSLH